MADGVVVSVGGKFTLDVDLIAVCIGVTACAVSLGVTTLNHKVLNNSVESKTVVEATVYKRNEVIYCVGSRAVVKLKNDLAVTLNAHLNVGVACCANCIGVFGLTAFVLAVAAKSEDKNQYDCKHNYRACNRVGNNLLFLLLRKTSLLLCLLLCADFLFLVVAHFLSPN